MKSTAARGYGSAHQTERRRWQKIINKTPTGIPCARGCGTRITSEDTWDLGHTEDRTTWTGPECIPCNRGAGGRNGAAAAHRNRTPGPRPGLIRWEW